MKDKQALLTALKDGTVTVNFTKADSTERTMKCTQNDELMTEYSYEAGEQTALAKEAESGLVRAYDLEAQGWRSFKTDRVQSWAQA